MNVNMIEHQRNILAALGIDLWVSKGSACQTFTHTSLYRDVAQSGMSTEIIVPQPVQQQQEIAVQLKSQPNPAVPEIVQNGQQQSRVAQVETQTEKAEPAQQLEIPAFALQAISTEHCVIVVDITDLTTEQNTLWMNIQRAISHQYYELKWPFPLNQFQDGQAASIYIQGFLDALKADKQLLSLGGLPYFHGMQLTQLASLQEMLEQPLLKRRLWQFMQNNVEQMEVK